MHWSESIDLILKTMKLFQNCKTYCYGVSNTDHRSKRIHALISVGNRHEAIMLSKGNDTYERFQVVISGKSSPGFVLEFNAYCIEA